MIDTIKNLIKTAEEEINENYFEHYGVRVMSGDYETDEPIIVNIGDITENSYDWDDSGNSTGNELNGTCALKVNENNIEKMLEEIEKYHYGNHKIVLLGSDYVEFGQDHHEVIMQDAKVLMIIK